MSNPGELTVPRSSSAMEVKPPDHATSHDCETHTTTRHYELPPPALSTAFLGTPAVTHSALASEESLDIEGSTSSAQIQENENITDRTHEEDFLSFLNQESRPLRYLYREIQLPYDDLLPRFDPDIYDSGAQAWCNEIQSLGRDFGWTDNILVAMAGRALRGSAANWFQSWLPNTGRSWINFQGDLSYLYPPKRNLSEKLSQAVLYASNSAKSYDDYAREKVRLLMNTKIIFSEKQLVDLVCGGITNLNVRLAAFASNSETVPDLISLLSAYEVQNQPDSAGRQGNKPKRTNLGRRHRKLSIQSSN